MDFCLSSVFFFCLTVKLGFLLLRRSHTQLQRWTPCPLSWSQVSDDCRAVIRDSVVSNDTKKKMKKSIRESVVLCVILFSKWTY